MTYIADLELVVNGPAPDDGLAEAGRRLGLPVKRIEGRADISSFKRFITEADGLFMRTDTFLFDSVASEMLHTVVRAGKRMLVKIDPNALELMNSFLEPYGMEGTRLAAFAEDPAYGHQRVISVLATQEPPPFANHPILQDVNELVLQQPQVIRVDDRASPLVSLSLSHVFLTDQKTDFFAEWPLSTFPVVACSDAEDVHGGVLALSGGFMHAPYTGPLGHAFPGITAGDNRRCAEQVAEWLCGRRGVELTAGEQAYTLLTRAEVLLARYVTDALGRRVGADWWSTHVPPAIRSNAERLCSREGGLLPARAYLGLPDLLRIVETNRSLLHADLLRAGWPSTDDSSDWFARVNQVRIRTMHPAKAALSGRVVSSDDVAVARDALAVVERLRSPA